MFTTVGLQRLLDAALSNAALGALTLKLFKNDYTPTATSNAGNFTESDFTGYSTKTLANATWPDAATSGGVASAAYPSQSWSVTSTGQTCYGYYVVNAAGEVLFAKRTASPVAVTNGMTLSIAVELSLEQPA